MTTRLIGISSMATRHILAELAAPYERNSGIKVEISSVGGVNAAKRVRAGEPFDIVVLASDAMESLEADGRLLTGSCLPFARSDMAIAFRADEPRPAVNDEAAVKQAILSARAIGYSTGPSGSRLIEQLKAWGIFNEVEQRLVQSPPGVPVADMVARGDVELGFQQLSELIGVPGAEVADPLPPSLKAPTLFVAGIASTCANPEAASALIAYLASDAAAGAKRRHGMEAP